LKSKVPLNGVGCPNPFRFNIKISRKVIILFITILVLCGRIGYNVLALGAVADFGAQNCQYTSKVDAR